MMAPRGSTSSADNSSPLSPLARPVAASSTTRSNVSRYPYLSNSTLVSASARLRSEISRHSDTTDTGNAGRWNDTDALTATHGRIVDTPSCSQLLLSILLLVGDRAK